MSSSERPAAKNHHPRCICEDPHEPGLTTCPCIADIYGGGECEHAAKRRLEKLLTEKSSAASEQELRLGEYRAQAQAWLDSHLPHKMTEPECVPCHMATNLILLCDVLIRAEAKAFANRVVDRLEPFPGDECAAQPPSNVGPCEKRSNRSGCHGALDGSYGWR